MSTHLQGVYTSHFQYQPIGTIQSTAQVLFLRPLTPRPARPPASLAPQQHPIRCHLPLQRPHLGVSDFDQADKLSNHSRARCSTGSELLVSICEISAGSGVTGKLGVAGEGSAWGGMTVNAFSSDLVRKNRVVGALLRVMRAAVAKVSQSRVCSRCCPTDSLHEGLVFTISAAAQVNQYLRRRHSESSTSLHRELIRKAQIHSHFH